MIRWKCHINTILKALMVTIHEGTHSLEQLINIYYLFMYFICLLLLFNIIYFIYVTLSFP